MRDEIFASDSSSIVQAVSDYLYQGCCKRVISVRVSVKFEGVLNTFPLLSVPLNFSLSV